MNSFKQFLEEMQNQEEKKDIVKTLSKIPPNHAALVSGFKWKFHSGNTLNGDDEHIGYIDPSSKEIAVAAPWNYGREFTILHEIAHKVWEKFIAPNPKLVHLWNRIVQRKTPDQKSDKTLDQSPEEIFCHSYAQYYSSNKIQKFTNPLWGKFIRNIGKI